MLFVFIFNAFFLASGNLQKKKKMPQADQPANGCRVELRALLCALGDVESHLWLSTHLSCWLFFFFFFTWRSLSCKQRCHHWKILLLSVYKPFSAMWQVNILWSICIFFWCSPDGSTDGSTCNIWHHVVHVDQCSNTLQILSAHHSPLRHGIYDYCIET